MRKYGTIRLSVLYDVMNDTELPINEAQRRNTYKIMRAIIYHNYIHFGCIIDPEDIEKVKKLNMTRLQEYTGCKNPSVHAGLYRLCNCVLIEGVDRKSTVGETKINMKPLVKRYYVVSKKRKTAKRLFHRVHLNYNHLFYLNYLKPEVHKQCKLKEKYEKKINAFFDERGGFKKYKEDIESGKTDY